MDQGAAVGPKETIRENIGNKGRAKSIEQYRGYKDN